MRTFAHWSVETLLFLRVFHLQVLGSYVPIPASSPSVSELRLRFSRVKFWLAVGSSFSLSVGRLLGSAGLVPTPPPLFGWRCRGRYQELLQQQQQQERMARVRNDGMSFAAGLQAFALAPAAASDAAAVIAGAFPCC